MEKLPCREELDSEPVASSEPTAQLEPAPNDWRTGLPELAGSIVTLQRLGVVVGVCLSQRCGLLFQRV